MFTLKHKHGHKSGTINIASDRGIKKKEDTYTKRTVYGTRFHQINCTIHQQMTWLSNDTHERCVIYDCLKLNRNRKSCILLAA